MIKQVKIKKREQIESKQNHDECVPMKYSRSKWNTNYTKKRQRRTTRLIHIRRGGIIGRETRYTDKSNRQRAFSPPLYERKPTWKTRIRTKKRGGRRSWGGFSIDARANTSGLTTSKKILEHCEDWQEGGEGREEGVSVSRYIVASGTFPDALTGHHSMEEKWSRALGLALIERRLKQWSKRDINHWKISGIYSSYELWQVKERD